MFYQFIVNSCNILPLFTCIYFRDTAGQEQYFALTKVYFRYSMGVVFVYDVTREQTLINMEKWFKAVEEVSNNSYHQLNIALILKF